MLNFKVYLHLIQKKKYIVNKLKKRRKIRKNYIKIFAMYTCWLCWEEILQDLETVEDWESEIGDDRVWERENSERLRELEKMNWRRSRGVLYYIFIGRLTDKILNNIIFN
jgi:hypothetical protein